MQLCKFVYASDFNRRTPVVGCCSRWILRGSTRGRRNFFHTRSELIPIFNVQQIMATCGICVGTKPIFFFSGERYDYILRADQSIGNYWLKAVSLMVCGPGYAIIRYEGAPDDANPEADPTEPRDGIVSIYNHLSIL